MLYEARRYRREREEDALPSCRREARTLLMSLTRRWRADDRIIMITIRMPMTQKGRVLHVLPRYASSRRYAMRYVTRERYEAVSPPMRRAARPCTRRYAQHVDRAARLSDTRTCYRLELEHRRYARCEVAMRVAAVRWRSARRYVAGYTPLDC